MYNSIEMAGDGQTMIEVGLIVILVSVVAIVALTNIGSNVNTGFTTVASKLQDGITKSGTTTSGK
jgi:pilus assembly protein Flp/PilA